MKKVLIIGATGSLARYVIEELKLIGGFSLTLFVRDGSRIPAGLTQGCRVVEGDALIEADVRKAVADQDIVYVNLAGDLERMATTIVKVMNDCHVKRIIAISSIGIYDKALKPVLIPYRKLADIVEASGLDYTILRPDWFTDGKEVDYTLTLKGEPESGKAISRKSIASFVSTLVRDPEKHSKENLGISKPG